LKLRRNVVKKEIKVKLKKPVKKRLKTSIHKLGLDRYGLQERIARKEGTVPYLFGLLISYISISFLVPMSVALFYGEDPRPWIYPWLLTTMVGIPLVLRYKSSVTTRPTEAILVLTTGWFVATIFGAIPFVMYGMGPLDAMFETLSGFTTTGATIMLDIESWPKSLLLWRSFVQWLGGAGIVMIFVTIFPMLGVAGRNLVRNETTGMDTQNVTLRVQAEAKKFHLIYLGLSLAQLGLLLLTGIGIYDASTVVFSTMSTGGFSPHTRSIEYFNDPVVEWIIIVFMFLAGTNFYLHFQAIASRSARTYWRNSEFRTYALLVVLFSAVGAALLWGDYGGGVEANIRASTFQMLSVMTSTGFATTDFSIWSTSLLFMLFALMVIGGSSGSTAGGLKVIRFVISRKFIAASLYKTVHPKAIFSIKLDGRILGENTVSSLMAVVMCYLGTIGACTVALALMGIEPMVSLSAAMTAVSNAGPALGSLGPMGTFGLLPDPAKMVLMFAMWAGRMEFLTAFAILTPAFWRELLRYKSKDEAFSRLPELQK